MAITSAPGRGGISLHLQKITFIGSIKLIEGTVQVTIIPIYEDGTRNNPANYQPAPFTNHFMKIFEIILHKINCGIA